MHGIQLKEGERILHVERSSLIPQLPMLLLGICLIVLPFFFFFPFLVFGLVGLIPPLLVAGLGLFLVLRTTVRWRGTLCVLTSVRIISVRQVGFIECRINGASLKKISDVAYKCPGLLGKFMRLGSVRILFRGVLPTMHFERIKRPEVLHDIISELRNLRMTPGTQSQSVFERVHLKTPTL